MAQALYLFKAARRPLYRKENLQLLAAERGSVMEVAYNRSWVAPQYWGEGAVQRGARVYFVFTERPYGLFVPVRQGEVLEAETDDLMLRLRVVLGNWIGVEDRDLADFTRLVQRIDANGVPGTKFVAPKRDGVVFTPYFDEREDEGWRRVVDHVLEASRQCDEDPYCRSVFFRPVALHVNGESLVARRVPLEPGTRATLVLGFHNPHLTQDDLARLELRALAAEDALRVDLPAHFPPTGELEVPFEVVGGEPVLTIQIGPAPAEHTSVRLRFGARTGEGAARRDSIESHAELASGSIPPRDADSIEAVAASREDVMRLYDVVFRNARMESADALDVLDAFQRLLPVEQRLKERRAFLLDEQGEEERAWHVLHGLDPEIMGDDARFLLFRLHAARDGGAGLLHDVLSLDLTAEGRFDRFVTTLESLPAHALARLVPALVPELPAEQLRPLMERAAARLESPDALADTANNLYMVTGDANWAYSFLDDRRRSLRLDGSVVVDALVDLAAAGGRSDDVADLPADVARRIGNLIERDLLNEARARLREAGRALRRSERDRLYHHIADRLERKRAFAVAAEVMVELGYSACASGDLAEATEAVERAQGLWAVGHGGDTGLPGNASADPAPPLWLSDAGTRVRAAWLRCEDLIEWRKTAEERRREAIRAQLAGKRILIAGGLRQPEWEQPLRELTGAEIDWAEKYRGEGDNLRSFADRIRSGRYALVIHRLQKSGHEVPEQLRDACKEVGVPWVPTPTPGLRGVEVGVSNGVSHLRSRPAAGDS